MRISLPHITLLLLSFLIFCCDEDKVKTTDQTSPPNTKNPPASLKETRKPQAQIAVSSTIHAVDEQPVDEEHEREHEVLQEPAARECIENPWRHSRRQVIADAIALAEISGKKPISSEKRKALSAEVKGFMDDQSKRSPQSVMIKPYDLDGDGQLDWMYTWCAPCHRVWPFHIYLSQNGCKTYAGRIIAGVENTPFPWKDGKNQDGVPALEAHYPTQEDPCEYGISYYEWSPEEGYKEVKSVTCNPCKDATMPKECAIYKEK